MPTPGHIDRRTLKSWADTLESKGEFPRLVRHLILETTPGVVTLGMPAGDGVAASGWDGSVRTATGNAWVPAGYSVWELSVDASPGAKADRDFTKRHATPDGTAVSETTYVEAILRPWTRRDAWAKENTAASEWKAVRALGLDDIDGWLDSAPVTRTWLSEIFGLNPLGLRTGTSWWESWRSQTAPEIPPDLVLAGRREQAGDLLRRRAPGVLTIAGQSVGDVCAFVSAVAVDADLRGDGQMLSRLAFVDELTTWRRLIQTTSPLVLVAVNPSFAAEVPPGCAHSIVVPTAGTYGADVSLSALDAEAVSGSLQAAGVTSREKADNLGRLGRRSLTALRRRLAKNRALVHPAWAQPPVPRALRTMLMLGSWADDNAGDRKIAEELSGLPYDAFRDECVRMSLGGDPVLISVSGGWHLVSPPDAWMLLSASLTLDDLERLKPAVVSVLGESDPALDLPVDARWWRASLEGKQRSHSGDLRRGVSRTLALLGTYGGATVSGTLTGSQCAAGITRQLLNGANSDPTGRAWQSLAPALPLLAEAAPDVVTDALTRALAHPDTPLATMFADPAAHPLFTGSPHAHLLWGLEVLAWSEQHFGQAVDLLARLDRLDPGGPRGNRPSNSLGEIFCPWHPETSVSAARRLKALDALRKRHPEAAWPLLISLLPSAWATHFPTAAPKYRDWKPAATAVTMQECGDFQIEAAARAMADAGTSIARWSQLIDAYHALAEPSRAALLSALTALAQSGSLDEPDRTEVWKKLQKLVHDHNEFADAEWALPQEELTKVETVASRFAPSTATARSAELFDDWRPYLGDINRRDDYQAYETALTERRTAAVSEIVNEGGLPAVLRLGRHAKLPWAVGLAFGAGAQNFDDDMFDLFDNTGRSDIELASAYFTRRFDDEDWAWARALLTRHQDAPAESRARVLLAIRDFPTSWEIAAESPAVESAYWRNFNYLGLGSNFPHVETVAAALIRENRYADALQFLELYMRRGTFDGASQANLVATALERLLSDQAQIASAGLQTYHFQFLVDALEEHVDELGGERVAGLEWAYLGALGPSPKVPALSRSLASSPRFFAEIVRTLYPVQGETEAAASSDTEGAARTHRAANAAAALRAWNQPPGLVDGVMQSEALSGWVTGMRAELNPSGLAQHGMRHLGQVLRSTPGDPDGTWPGAAVRDILETLQDEDLDEGLYLAIVNSRGLTSRRPEAGGAQEYELVAKYDADAMKVADDAPRTAGILRKVAESYMSDARWNEATAERFRNGIF